MEVVSIALETVRDFLIQKAIFISGVSSQVEEIQGELIRMQGFMKDIDRRQQKDHTVRIFANQFRQLAYRVEDVLETYTIKVQSDKEGNGFQNTLKRFVGKFTGGIDLREIGSEIEDIKSKLNTLISRMESFGIQERVQNTSKEGQSSTQNQNWWRETYPHQVEEFFVGMKDDIRQLVSKITDERNNDEGYRSHGIISVYGMGGLGKTTIAKQIYKDIEVRRCFKAFAWVSVTQLLDRRTIFRTILKQIVPNSNVINNMEERELIDELYKAQKEKKCLVVLDDLWKIDDWRCLNPAFPFAEANSKILVTTRNQKLAEDMGGFPYSLPFLSEEEGWELLQKKAFSRNDISNESEIDPELKVIGREIVSKCGNLPLAISVIGGILSEKSSLPEWQTVNKDVDFYLRMADSSEKEYGTVLQVLALSYDELPYYLKPCFLYLGHFKEDEEIHAPRLYEMWIAEGMVSPNHGGSEDTLTDVAERYLLEMSGRSMVQLKFREFSTRRTVERCRLHDLMRDFCLTRAKEVDFLGVLALKEGNIPSPDTSSLDRSKPSRYSILIERAGEGPSSDNYDNDAMINASLSSIDEPVRSLSVAVTPRRYVDFGISFPGEIYQSKKFKSLRLLGFDCCNFKGKGLPDGIKELIHLRYLSFFLCAGLTKLPSSIGQLQYLRTLRIEKAFGDLEVPNVLWRLKRLMFLSLPDRVKVEGKGKGRGRGRGQGKLCLSGLSKMETLHGFNSDVCEFSDLWEMINLRDFHANIYIREHEIVDIVRPLLHYLNSNRHKLREATIIVYFDRNGVVPLEELLGFSMVHTNHSWIIRNGKCEFQKLEPPYPCSNLVSLWFCWGEIEGDPMDCLGKLPNLKDLFFDDVDLLDKVIVCGAHSFPKLEKLNFYRVKNFEDWIVFQGGLSKLSKLSIWECPALKMIPDGLKFAVTLKELYITRMPPEFKQGVFEKFGHVPTIFIFED